MPLLLGIIGCGRVTEQLHLPALRFVPAIKVAALADVAPFNEFRIVGDRGALSFSLYHADSFALANSSQPSFGLRERLSRLSRLHEFPELLRVARSGGDYLLSYREQWNRFAAAVGGESAPASSFAEGLSALKVVHAALASRDPAGQI